MKQKLRTLLALCSAWCSLSVMAVAPGAPGEVTNLKFSHDYNGLPTIGISFSAPTETSGGDALSSITKLDVYCGQDLIKTFDTVNPGQSLQMQYTAAQKGEYTFRIIATNSAGAGDEASDYTYVGADIASPVTNVRLYEDPQAPGTAIIEWDAPTTYQEGSPINPAIIKYEILAADGITSLRDNIEGTTTSFEICAPSERSLCNFFIISVTDKPNYSYYSMTPLLAVGKSYDADYSESFAGAKATTVSGGLNDFLRGSWAAAASSSSPAATPYDNDGGLMAYKPRKAGNESRWYSGKIALPEISGGNWSFRYYASSSSNAILQPFVYADGELHYADSFPQKGDNTWHLASMDLTPYSGKNVQVGVYVLAGDKDQTLVDNVAVSVTGAPAVQLASFNTPEYIYVQERAPIEVTLSNRSDEPQTVFVSLMSDSEELAGNGFTIPAHDVYTIRREWIADTDMPGHVHVLLAVADADTHNDILFSDERIISIRHKGYPVPTAVEWHPAGEDDVILTWNTPDFQSLHIAEQVTDDFDNYESFSIDRAGDWIFEDADAVNETYGFTDFSFPNMGKPMAWIVFDSDGMNQTFAAASGTKCMASFSSPYGANDNWMISPDLPGDGGTLSFAARSYSSSDPEDFEVLVSYTGNRPEQFSPLASEKAIGYSWQTYAYSIPAGANYFAIRSTSDDKFFIMLDDVTFTRGIGNLALTGYRIYCDYEEVGFSSVEDENTFTISGNRGVRYNVKAVYTRGESDYSLAATEGVGVNTTEMSALTWRVDGSMLYVDNPRQTIVSVYSTSGMTMYQGTETSVQIPLFQGVYIVSAGAEKYKILLR